MFGLHSITRKIGQEWLTKRENIWRTFLIGACLARSEELRGLTFCRRFVDLRVVRGYLSVGFSSACDRREYTSVPRSDPTAYPMGQRGRGVAKSVDPFGVRGFATGGAALPQARTPRSYATECGPGPRSLCPVN